MKTTIDCYNKVKQDCYKFIKSQETKTNKFKDKNKMLKSYLIPTCFWIAKKSNKKSPLIIGLSGGQGTGKTTIVPVDPEEDIIAIGRFLRVGSITLSA